MLQQLPKDKSVLYFNNEQAGVDVKRRLVSSVTGMSGDACDLNPVEALKNYKERGGDRFHIYDKSFMDYKFVQERLRRHKNDVGLVLFDQLWKVQGFAKHSSNDFMQLAKQFTWARDIAKEYAPTIAVHQLSGDVAGTKYIDMQAMFGSRVAIQGEADAIITIGRTTDGTLADDIRHIHVPKNKLRGSDPTMRNAKFDCRIEHTIAKFGDIK